jgi:hypothetical protein
LIASSGCVGDESAESTPTPGPDGSAPSDAGGGSPDSATTNESGPPADAGVDAAPPACTKIQVSTLSGTGAAGSANGAGNIATFDAPEGITVDSSGSVYVADTGNKLVRKVLSDGTTTTFAGPTDFITLKRLVWSGDLLVTDHGNSNVRRIGSNGVVVGTPYFYLSSILGIAAHPSGGGVYVSNPWAIAKYNSGTFATEFSGASPPGFSDGTAASGKYDWPQDIAFDGASVLYAADLNNHRIRKVTIGVGADNGDIVTLAGAATAGHVDGTGGAARFEGPNGIVVDPTTHLIYVADGSTIRVVTPTGEVSTLVGSTAAFLDGDGCTAKFTGLKSITKYANELYVVDVQRIRKIVMN